MQRSEDILTFHLVETGPLLFIAVFTRLAESSWKGDFFVDSADPNWFYQAWVASTLTTKLSLELHLILYAILLVHKFVFYL